MDGPSHYREAERCLAFAAVIETDGDQESMSAWYQRQAQVFATLALTAATVAGSRMSQEERQAWDEASAGGLHTPLSHRTAVSQNPASAAEPSSLLT